MKIKYVISMVMMFLIILTSISAAPTTPTITIKSVMVNTNGVLVYPPYFWRDNSNSIFDQLFLLSYDQISVGDLMVTNVIGSLTLTNVNMPYQELILNGGSNVFVSAKWGAMTMVLTNNAILYPTNGNAGSNFTALIWITQSNGGGFTILLATNALGEKWKLSGGLTNPINITATEGAVDLLTITADKTGTNFVGIITPDIR